MSTAPLDPDIVHHVDSRASLSFLHGVHTSLGKR
jgi:hypothetical protein